MKIILVNKIWWITVIRVINHWRVICFWMIHVQLQIMKQILQKISVALMICNVFYIFMFQHFTQKSARFQCTFCRKSFSEKWYLKTHENTHRGIYPYNCPVCSKGLLTTQHLRLHLKKHQAETGSYLCMKCNNQFQSSEALEEHIIFCANGT
jgi:transposase-like protein